MEARRSIGVILVLGALFAGCSSQTSSPAASPALERPAQCERQGGRWHADSNVCEYQMPGGGTTGPH
jgi:hypothetical protein